jgi:hypothetical protein
VEQEEQHQHRVRDSLLVTELPVLHLLSGHFCPLLEVLALLLVPQIFYHVPVLVGDQFRSIHPLNFFILLGGYRAELLTAPFP